MGAAGQEMLFMLCILQHSLRTDNEENFDPRILCIRLFCLNTCCAILFLWGHFVWYCRYLVLLAPSYEATKPRKVCGTLT